MKVSAPCEVTLADTQCVCYTIRSESFNIIQVTLQFK